MQEGTRRLGVYPNRSVGDDDGVMASPVCVSEHRAWVIVTCLSPEDKHDLSRGACIRG